KEYVDIPVICAGRMEPEVGAASIAKGRIDAIAVGRQFLADQKWVTKLMEDREEDIRPCICCHAACFDLTKYEGSANAQDFNDSIHMCRCAVNPMTMHTDHYKIVRTKHPKRVAVIGGGIGGMEAARVLKQRGHFPEIYEKSDHLGGIFIAAAAPDFKENDKRLIEWFKRQIELCGIPVHLNTEVTDIGELDVDEVIIATGSEANHIPVPGAENGMDACDYLYGTKEVGENVVIIGGGLTGCEIAYDLFRKGKNPTIVEMKNDLMAVKNLCLANSSYLRDFFKANKVPVYLSATVKDIRKDGVTITDKNGETVELAADSVILSVGYHSKPLHEPMRYVQVIGDASKVGNLRSVIWGAWDAAMKI
ncbi:MAG: FAD-dependent oxidoreductase, partial [Eubacterium sp.]|nr:FAD-dependent oxidoreductase [Eubacterium sp.]